MARAVGVALASPIPFARLQTNRSWPLNNIL